MKIVIYIESLRTFTSGMPHRGVLPKLIEMRNEDDFILVLRKGDLPECMQELFDNLKTFTNWTLVYEKRSRKLVNILAPLHFQDHCKINVEGDIYLSFDAEHLGTSNSPQIITLHDLSSVRDSVSSSMSFIKRFARKFTIENAVNHADHIVAISEFTKKDILDYFDIDDKKITTIYNGIDSKWFEEDFSTKDVKKEKYWIWWGAYSKRKNLESLLLAYALMLQESSENITDIPKLFLVGNKNDYFEKLLLIVNGSTLLKSKVEFFPQKDFDDLKNFVAGSDGLVFPSVYEGFGLPVIEAYSQGIPVMTSKVSSLPEISGNLGILVDPMDIQDIKNGLVIFHSRNSNEVEKRKQFALQFTYEKAAVQYSKLIDTYL